MHSLLERTKPLFAQAFQLYQTHWQALSLTALVPMAPVAVFGIVIDYFITPLFLPGALLGALLTLLFLLPASIMAGVLAQGLLLVQYEALTQTSTPLGIGEAFRRLSGRAVPLLFTAFVSSFLILAGLVLFILPGAFFAYRLCAVAPAVVLEKKWGMSAMLRSSEIVREAKTEFWVLFLALSLLSSVLSHVVEAFLPSSIDACASALATAISLPVWTLGLAFLYRDVIERTRRTNATLGFAPDSTIA